MLRRSARVGFLLLVVTGAALLAMPALAQAKPQSGTAHVTAPRVALDDNGTVHVPAMSVPVSEFLSPAGKAYVAQHLKDMQNPKALALKDGIPAFLAGYLNRDRALYAVDQKDTKIAGVHAVVFTPKAGIAAENAKRVLIDLHGGGFMGCWRACSQLESLPIAALGRIKVVSLDYRESPGYRFPAASEDVAAVYRELLKTYPAKNIGIYGCSAGGMLTGESVAWFETHNLPMPGAIGMFCSGLTIAATGFGGDAGYIAMPLGEARMPAPPRPDRNSGLPYFKGTDVKGPTISVADHPEMLAKFPPSLIVTGTRDFAMSSAVYTHTQLVNAGATSDLHVWEGMFHGFFYNPDVPESRDCYSVIVRFFEGKLAGG